jgi:Cu+-exporting ATPase
MMTGESEPVKKNSGDEVIGSTVALTGTGTIRATRTGSNTTLQQIVRLVERAQLSKAPIARLADTISGYFVQVVIAIALITFIIWYTASPTDKLSSALIPFISVLIIACPCALGLATPTAIMIATGRASELGILIRKGAALEYAHKLDTVVFDKTGTITDPIPTLSRIIPVNGFTEERLLSLAAAVERNSSHPLAKSIMREAEKRHIEYSTADFYIPIEGKGVTASVYGENISITNEPFLEYPSQTNNSALYLRINNNNAGIFIIEHTIKPGASEAVRQLQKLGITVMMLTGDNEAEAARIAGSTGILTYQAGILPYQKTELIRQLQAQGHKVGMVGDGINDAPALAQADVGFAIGTGTDVAMEAADITLMRDDLSAVVDTLNLSRRTFRIIKENLFFSFFYNSLGIPIAAGILFIPFGIIFNPMIGALAMAFSDVTVIGNSLRLRRFRK